MLNQSRQESISPGLHRTATHLMLLSSGIILSAIARRQQRRSMAPTRNMPSLRTEQETPGWKHGEAHIIGGEHLLKSTAKEIKGKAGINVRDCRRHFKIGVVMTSTIGCSVVESFSPYLWLKHHLCSPCLHSWDINYHSCICVCVCACVRQVSSAQFFF